jgi:hypothetical protein
LLQYANLPISAGPVRTIDEVIEGNPELGERIEKEIAEEKKAAEARE